MYIWIYFFMFFYEKTAFSLRTFSGLLSSLIIQPNASKRVAAGTDSHFRGADWNNMCWINYNFLGLFPVIWKQVFKNSRTFRSMGFSEKQTSGPSLLAYWEKCFWVSVWPPSKCEYCPTQPQEKKTVNLWNTITCVSWNACMQREMRFTFKRRQRVEAMVGGEGCRDVADEFSPRRQITCSTLHRLSLELS